MAIYEMRTYTLQVGKMAEAVKLYTELGYPALQKSGQDKELIGYFQDERGLLFEHFVAGELHGRTGTLWPEMSLHHYRSRGGADLSGLRSSGETLPRVKRKIVVFLGPRAQRIDDVEALPLEEFLAELPH